MSVEHANQNKQLTFGMTVCFINCMLSNFEYLIAEHTMTGTLLEHVFYISIEKCQLFFI